MPRGRIHTINLAVYPERLPPVLPGDIVRVVTEFDYAGPALENAKMISAIWHPTLLDPHNEIVRGEKVFNIPDSPLPGNHITVTIDLLVPSGEVGTDYGLYSSIRDVPGPDIYCEPKWLENIITIEEVVPEFKGTISRKELEYNGFQRTIPVSNVPQGERGKVHVWGRNDMVISQKLGIHFIVKDPDGVVVQDYEDWEFGTTGPGDDHHFYGPWFDLNKPGTWTIAIGLSMNPASPLNVDIYSGVLCTVAAAPPEEYTLEVTIEPPGAGLVLISPSKATYSAGEVVTLVATPNPGYEFDHWGGWPAYPGAGSTSSTLNITMTANWWVVAAFREVAPPQYTLEVTVEPPATGYVTKSPSKALYSAGEVVTLTAYPYSGYEFDHWGGWPAYPGVGSTSPTLQITMDADKWVVAVFREAVPVVTTVKVSLKNAPSGCEWQMAVYDWNETEHISKFRLSFNESAIYDIPSGWVFPLRVDILIYNPATYRVYYRMHSTSDSFPQYHKDIFIEDFGEYYFNLATEKFEKV